MAASKGSVPICVISRHVIALPIPSVWLHPLPNQGGPLLDLSSTRQEDAPPFEPEPALRHHPASPLRLFSGRPGCRLLPSRACRAVHLTRFAFPSHYKPHNLESGRRPITNNPARAGLFGCLPVQAAVASPSLTPSSITPDGNDLWSDADRQPAGSAPGRRGQYDRPQRRPRWRIH